MCLHRQPGKADGQLGGKAPANGAGRKGVDELKAPGALGFLDLPDEILRVSNGDCGHIRDAVSGHDLDNVLPSPATARTVVVVFPWMSRAARTPDAAAPAEAKGVLYEASFMGEVGKAPEIVPKQPAVITTMVFSPRLWKTLRRMMGMAHPGQDPCPECKYSFSNSLAFMIAPLSKRAPLWDWRCSKLFPLFPGSSPGGCLFHPGRR